MSNIGTALPVRVILDMLQIGVDALVTDALASVVGERVLDHPSSGVWRTMAPAELAKMVAYYQTNPPTVQAGYARANTPFPAFSVVMSSDRVEQKFIGHGEIATLDDNDQKTGNESHRWTKATFTILVYAEHPDICAAYYRVARRIVNAGIGYLIARGLDNPTPDGAELAPDPRYTPDNMFVRRLSLTVEYDEEWAHDALWVALNGGTEEAYITSADQLDIKHEDLGGGVRPRIFVEATAEDPNPWDTDY